MREIKVKYKIIWKELKEDDPIFQQGFIISNLSKEKMATNQKKTSKKPSKEKEVYESQKRKDNLNKIYLWHEMQNFD